MFASFADRTKIELLLDSKPQLARLVHEFCHTFGCLVGSVNTGHNMPSVNLVTKSGLHGGSLQYAPTGTVADQEMFFYKNHTTVSKERGSAFSDRGTRDSTKIATLIRVVKNKGEGPSDDKVIEKYKHGIAYAFRSTRGNESEATLHLSNDLTVALANFYLGIDTTGARLHDAAIREEYKQYMENVKVQDEAETTFKRFAAGSHLIGLMTDETPGKVYYLYGRVKMDVATRNYTFHEGLKRYASLKEVEALRAHVPIIATWANGVYHEFKDDNELGLPRNDHYYTEIDVASGYSTGNQVWVLIPETGT